MLTIGLVQYDVTGGLSERELWVKIRARCEAAAERGAGLVVFPELFTADLFENGADVASELRSIERICRDVAPAYPGKLAALARDLGVAILGGSLPRLAGDSGGIHNTAYLAFADGRWVAQNKLFLTRCESEDWGWKPGTSLEPVLAPWGRTWIAICLDVEMPSLSALAAAERPELILVPSSTGSIHGYRRVRWCAQARAIEHHAFVAQVGTVGTGTTTPNMKGQYGQAVILTPSDEGFPGVLAEGPANEPGLVLATLDLGHLRENRKTASVYPAREQVLRSDPPGLGRIGGEVDTGGPEGLPRGVLI